MSAHKNRATAKTPFRRGRVAQVLAGAAVATAGCALVAGAVFAGEESALQRVPVPSTAVPAGDYVGLCPEPPKLLEGIVSSSDSEFSPESDTARSVVTAMVLNGPAGTIASGSLTELGADGSPVALADPAEPPADLPADAVREPLQAAVLSEQEVDAFTVFRTEPLPAQAAPAGAVLAYTAQDGDLRGLAAANCQRPSNDLWLVGANTTVGQTAVLSISNASETPATVDLELYGAEGPITAPGSRGILVAPGESEQIVLAGLASDQPSLAVRVRSSGGPVSALVQQSVLRNLTPGGVEYLAPSTGATEQVMTGVVIQPQDIAQSISGQDGYAASGPALQIAVPGSSEAVLEVRVFGADGQEPLPDGGVLSVPAATVHEISLADLPAGTYTIAVSSDVPVAAAARSSRGVAADEPVDFAFSPSSDQMGSQHIVAVPSGVASELAFGAPEAEASVAVRRVFDDGRVSAPTSFAVAAGSTERIDAGKIGEDDGGTVVGYVIGASGGPVYGAQILNSAADSPDISVLALPDAVTGQQALPIVLGY